MLESVLIQNFKGFKNTSIGPFRKVNLLIGGQNVGKTSVLETIYSGATIQPQLAGRVFRPQEGHDNDRYNHSYRREGFFTSVSFDVGSGVAFAEKSMVPNRMSVKVSGRLGFGEGESLGIQAWYTGSSTFSGAYGCSAIPDHLPSQLDLVTLFGKVILQRKKKDLISLLKKVEDRLEGLDAIAPDGEQRIYVEMDRVTQALPIGQLGHGFNRLVRLFSELLVSDSRLALIDEIENGIHYSALPTLFEGIKAVAMDRNVQSVITTHSWDCLRAACEVFEDIPDLFQVIRLERQEDDVKAVCIDGERMLRLMAEEREVR